MLLVQVYYDETVLIRRSAAYTYVMRRLLPTDLAVGAERVTADERQHREFGRAVLRRLRSTYPELADRGGRPALTTRLRPILEDLGRIYRSLAGV